MRLHCFSTVNSSVNAARSSCRWKFHGKDIKLKTLHHGYVISLGGVVVRCSCVDHKVPGASPTEFFFSFFLFFPFFCCCCFLLIYT